MRARERRAGASGGFTLLELLIAMAMLALIAGSVTAGLRIAAASIERGEEAAREAARLRAAVVLVERSIRSADPARVPGGSGRPPFFIGDAKSIRFLTARPPAAAGPGGPRLMSFHEAPGPDGGLAASTISPFRAGGVESWDAAAGRRILLPGAGALAFSYSSGPDADGNWEWADTWDMREKGNLPAAVRVEFTILGKGEPRKTAFVVTVPAGGGLGR